MTKEDTENKTYLLPCKNTLEPERFQNGSNLEPQIRLGKIRLDKDRVDSLSADADAQPRFDYIDIKSKLDSIAWAVSFAVVFFMHFNLFQTRGYSCVHGIQMIFYGMNAWGFGILAAVCGGRK